jgi:prephenate dehydrogenase
MNITIIGLGLIGGSLALQLKNNGFATRIIGVDNNHEHQEQALKLKLVDEIRTMQDAFKEADLVIIAIPADSALRVLPIVLDGIADHTIVVDMGSTKASICHVANEHERRKQFVATHPMAGTEHSGPAAAIENLFTQKTAIICNSEESSENAINIVDSLFHSLEMRMIEMDAGDHDLHIAYVSHLSHITSFVLGETVLEKEKEVEHIFNMASSGFASTVRLAKSSPDMWAPIFLENATNISDVLKTYIANLQKFKNMIDRKDVKELKRTMKNANRIRKII